VGVILSRMRADYKNFHCQQALPKYSIKKDFQSLKIVTDGLSSRFFVPVAVQKRAYLGRCTS
jgi:hypothetical protein